MFPNKPEKAFTLVELSIVIVIIGLIIAGVTAGKGLVRQAKLQGVMSDITKYTSAYNSFKLQYNAVPGDMKNASSYWTTTNGDGNGYVTPVAEPYLAWQHLALAKLISGSYTGAASGENFVVGINAPRGPIRKSGYQFISQFNHSPIYGRGKTENGIRFGQPIAASPNSLNTGVISPGNAYLLDKKLDDGLASRGKIVANASNFAIPTNGVCVTGPFTGAAGSSNYIMTDTSDSSCVMQFWIGK